MIFARETIELPYNPAVADIRRDRPTNTPNSWPTCSEATSSVHAPCRFVAPYPVAVDVRTIADIDPVYAWAEASTVRDGLRLAAQFDEAAQYRRHSLNAMNCNVGRLSGFENASPTSVGWPLALSCTRAVARSVRR